MVISQKYDFKKIEQKWQKKWERERVFEVKENIKKKKYYVLEMFPYPSGSKLHMGHAFNYTIGDIYARFKRMNGFNVLYPMGYDSFGLPAENAAIKEKKHPKETIKSSTENYSKQLKSLGLSYDWTRTLKTSDLEYYKWNQYFFLKFLEKGLAYKKKSSVNWCPKCKTVLANEQVHQGKCWRHKDTRVEIKHLEQWFIKTTDYADELLEGIDDLEWPSRIKTMQKNWIGRSEGTEIDFIINGEKYSVFTTRPDTIYGVTFMVISAQHPRLMDFVVDGQKEEVEKFFKKMKSVSEKEMGEIEKEGVFTGSYAINPINDEKIPVYVGNFVVSDYGSGIVMAVPAHDQRDFEFAEKYNISIKIVVKPKDFEIEEKSISEAYTGEGYLINSDRFNGIENKKAIEKITNLLKRKGFGRKSIQFKLRDWLISRQRYWGTPIPVIYCASCGIVSVPEKDLPVLLPEKVEFGKGNPLETNKDFIEVKCPKCNDKARRETDTMDTFFDSSWYYLRYIDNKNNKLPFDKKKINYWMPVNQYIGGAEHATMHLIYARFFTKALRDMGFFKFDEPFIKLFNQGMLHGKDGFVMSKSRGNGVYPDVISDKYGIDTARLFLVSIASPDKDIAWSDEGIQGSYKFINKILHYSKNFNKFKMDSTLFLKHKLNTTIKEVSNHIELFEYNLAIIKLRELFNCLEEESSKKDFEKFLKLLHPFCPHLTEELWEKIGNKPFISLEKWPVVDETKINEKFDKEEKIISRTIGDINNVLKILNEKNVSAEKVYLYVIPGELDVYSNDLNKMETRTGLSVKIYSVSDKNKYDPDNKSKKVKPGKPGIYIE